MRIDFQDSGSTQEPVTQAQVDMRGARAKKRPVLRILILLALVGAGAYAAYLFSRIGAIYTYGMVTAEFTPYYAPFEGIIKDLDLERGQLVSQGDVLFTLTPAPPDNVREAQDALIGEIDRLNEKGAELRQNVIDQAKHAVERAQTAYDEDNARRRAAAATAAIELEKAQSRYANLKRQAERIVELYTMDAAVQSDVEAARNAADIAYKDLKQTNLARRLARNQRVASGAALEMAKLELQRLTEENAADATALERGRIQLSVAQTLPDELSVTSLFDGIVLEVGAMPGSRVEESRIVVSVGARDRVWVETYVPEKKARFIRTGGEALIYLPGESEPLAGTIAHESGVAIRVPELLRDDMPGFHTGILVRIDFELSEGMPLFPGGQVRVVIPTSD